MHERERGTAGGTRRPPARGVAICRGCQLAHPGGRPEGSEHDFFTRANNGETGATRGWLCVQQTVCKQGANCPPALLPSATLGRLCHWHDAGARHNAAAARVALSPGRLALLLPSLNQGVHQGGALAAMRAERHGGVVAAAVVAAATAVRCAALRRRLRRRCILPAATTSLNSHAGAAQQWKALIE